MLSVAHRKKYTSSQAVQVGQTVYVSGCLGLDKDTMKLVSGGAANEAKKAIENLEAVLVAADSSLSNVVKTTVLLEDINDFTSVNDVYKTYFKEPFPARACYQVGKLPLGAKIEIEVIAISGPLETKL
ncbi:reactive intermediate imine deaminase A homolog UK114 isoform X2 [Rhodnius prolixus]|uniref:reactive intermediate imine deaminase A homolog UK114 isoform X2 n=1 Tax=Rhodnius prolixus TaxID=13249 RepID=UPI003D188587